MTVPTKNPRNKIQHYPLFLGCMALVFLVASSVQAKLTVQKLEDDVYANVQGETVSLNSYKEALQAAVRQKFYHGKIPEGKMEELQREVGKELITKTMLIQEAKRRGFVADKDWMKESLEKTLADYEKRYGKSDKWEEYRQRFIPRLTKYLENNSLLLQLKQQVENIDSPTEKEVRAYYRQNKDKFTSPEQLRVAVILLKVAPSSPVVAWQEAVKEAERLYKQLQEGADFAELARLHSGDKSAENGGDMGYLHKGMLAPQVQEPLDKMKAGEITKPIKLLSGVSIFKLLERKPAVLNAFEKVQQRATDLLKRERRLQARDKLVDSLWKKTAVLVNSKYYTVEKDGDKKVAEKMTRPE